MKGVFASGTTALVAVIHGTQLAVANVGDSRGVMCTVDGRVIPLSFDHKPDNVSILMFILYRPILLPFTTVS